MFLKDYNVINYLSFINGLLIIYLLFSFIYGQTVNKNEMVGAL